ncbi:unnamed protein product [Spirodela intermedia]|uniref:Uncharacterized protein n=1 Tax=Spirodela intermedia TaxID=51605 RepID=A0A7I8LGY2_SPIIN|nr:unnamed protein product [Spirodela intermedia]
MIDVASGGTFMNKYEDEAIELIETLAKNSAHHYALNQNGRFTGPRKRGIHDLKNVETGLSIDKSSATGFDHQQLKTNQDMVDCVLCLSYEHVKVDCPKYDQPYGIVEDVIVKIENFYFPADFIIADMKIIGEHNPCSNNPWKAILSHS